jgi:hypothetical protein
VQQKQITRTIKIFWNRCEDGEWGMANGEWGMGNGEWGVVNGEWGMGNGE